MSVFQKLSALHAEGDVEFRISRELGHPKYNRLIMALSKTEEVHPYRDLVEIAQTVGKLAIWIGGAVYAFLAADRGWFWAMTWLIGGFVGNYQYSKMRIQALVIRNALAREEVLDQLWSLDLVSLFSKRLMKHYGSQDPRYVDWRNAVEELSKP
jgi:hypothetical protein